MADTDQIDLEQVLYVKENAVIAEFPPNMPIEDTVFARVNERFEDLAARPEVDTHISVLQMENAMNSDVFERAQEAAEAGKAFDITTWVMVSTGIKRMALESQVGEIDGVETMTAETKAEALDLANS